jgi:hypothetical protein
MMAGEERGKKKGSGGEQRGRRGTGEKNRLIRLEALVE